MAEALRRFGNLDAVKRQYDQTTEASRDPNKDAALTRSRLEEEVTKRRLENEGIKQNHEDQQANREMRFSYSKWVFFYLVGYSVCVLILLLLSGYGAWGFTLDPEVLKFLVGSTAAAAIGLVAAVTTGLFNKK